MGIDATMCFRTKTKIEKVNRLAAALHAAFPNTTYVSRWQGFKHCIIDAPIIGQDGPEFECPAGLFQYEVNLSSRYYGEGYERGDIMSIVGVAMFLQANVPDVEIFYGGDSSGVCFEPFTPARQQELLSHLFKFQHEPYRRGFNSNTQAICPNCERVASNFLWAQSVSAARCSGCEGVALFKDGAFAKWCEDPDNYQTEVEALKSI